MLLCLVWRMKEFGREDFMDDMLQYTASLLIDHPQLKGKVSLSRMFTTLCKLEGDIERVRVFCYDLLRERSYIDINLLYNIVTVWPEALQHNGAKGKHEI